MTPDGWPCRRRPRAAPLDYAAAFLDKTIVPGYVNDAPVARYRAYIETNDLQGMVTLGARLWDLNAQNAFDLDYGRGFLRGRRRSTRRHRDRDAAARTRAPGLYCVTFDSSTNT